MRLRTIVLLVVSSSVLMIGVVVAMAAHAQACTGVVNGSGGAFGSGGGVTESCLPNGDKYHCESVYVLGFGGQNCYVIPKGDPRNPW